MKTGVMNFTANYKLQQDFGGCGLYHAISFRENEFYSNSRNIRPSKITCYAVLILQLWVRAFRDREFHFAVNTNNGTESVFKYHYLPRKKKMMLSSIITLIVEVFLPESYQKYLFLNYKQSSQCRTYNAFVPDYLHGRPKAVISHCLERRSKAMKYTTEEITVLDDKNGIFTVRGTSGKDHSVTFALPSCSCRDWTTWHLPCKHFFGIFSNCPKWNWNSLPESYLTGAYLSTDRSAIADFFQPSVEADLVWF